MICSPALADVVLDDFARGVTAVNHPEGAGQPGVWYDATNATYGSAAATTLDGNSAMRIDDGGYANGVYAIYNGVVPADGEYTIEVDMKIFETGSPTGFSTYQLGVAVGADAQHRGLNPSSLAACPIVASYSGLTAGDDSANPVQKLATATFTASAGDSILIAFATDVSSGTWSQGSAAWAANYVVVDNLVLKGADTPPPPPSTAEDALIDDFSGGVLQANNPDGRFGVWYDTTTATYGTPSASVLDGSPAMRIDDGGYANGVYAIYQAVVPADGVYKLEADVGVVETATGLNGIRGFQVGVAVGSQAVDRTGAALGPLSITGTYIGLTPGDDTANPTQTIVTGEFLAHAGDNLLIAFGTDVESGNWGGNSALWNGSYVLVDNLYLRGVVVEPPPFELILDNDDGPSVYASTGFSSSGTTGFDGGTYQFATAGAAGATASWTGNIPEAGYYEVSAIFRAGSNRASVARYEVTTSEGLAHATVDQRSNNLSWVELGDYELEAGLVTITVNAEESETTATGTVVIADAIRIRELGGPPPIDPPEMRIANLLVYDSLNDVGRIQNFINDIVRKRYNAVAVHTRYRGDATYFPNKEDATFPNSEPRNPLVGDVDVLQEVVDRGHEAGLKVFAYVNTMLVTEGTDTDPRPGHVLNEHPDWVTYEYNGGAPIPQTTATEIDGIWLDSALPEVQVYNAGIIADIVLNYAVDGVVIDRQRYPDTRYNRLQADYGYHPEAIALFNAQYGKTGIPDPFDQDWWEFRRQATVRSMQQIYSTVVSINPGCLVMAYPIGRYSDAIDFEYQDWPTWLKNKVIDVVIPQNYTSSNAEFSARAAETKNAYSGDRFLGLALDVFRPGTDLVGQVNIARTLGFQGTSLFHHSAMGPLGYFDILGNAWVGIAPWPETPWKAEPVQCDGLDIIGSENDDLLVGTICDEIIIGGPGSDEIIAGGGNDYIIPDPAEGDGIVGDDRIDGGDGIDTIDYSPATVGVYVDLEFGFAIPIRPRNRFGIKAVGEDEISNIENVIGTAEGDIIIGTDGPNNIQAASGDAIRGLGDYVEGRGGDDVISLGGPNAGGILSIALGGDGNDIIIGSGGMNALLDGGAGDDTITAFGAAMDVLKGGPGNDILDGGAGMLDMALFDGRYQDYTFCLNGDGDLVVTDTTGGDGVDVLRNIEMLCFSNRLVMVRKLVLVPCE